MYLLSDCVSERDKCLINLYTEKGVLEDAYDSTAQDLLKCIEKFIKVNKLEKKELKGLVVISGVGSFMAGRVSTSAVNGFGQSLGIPVLQHDGKEQLSFSELKERFGTIQVDAYANTRYASEPNIKMKHD